VTLRSVETKQEMTNDLDNYNAFLSAG